MRTVLNRYGLSRQPFSKEIPADELFVAKGHEDIGKRLKAAIEGRASAVARPLCCVRSSAISIRRATA